MAVRPQSFYDVAIVGAGILGLACAYSAAKQGRSVAVFERDPQAAGASVRNFGMIWPVGQPAGEMREMAMRSREIWLEVLRESGIWFRDCGSLHLAYAEDEMAVLREFCDLGPGLGYEVSLSSPEDVHARCPAVLQKGLVGGMWSAQELCVDPRQVTAELPNFLRERHGVELFFGASICEVSEGTVAWMGGCCRASEVIVCTGSDISNMFPERFASPEIRRCKLQMVRARPVGGELWIGPHLCGGLTLGHYRNFQVCKSLPSYLDRVRRESPEYVQWGIHVLVSQHEGGEITIGDSHEYGEAVSPFNREEIDRLILGYLGRFLPLNRLEVFERWHGVYVKDERRPYVAERVEKGVTAVMGAAGAGMTLSFGLAERLLRSIE